MFIIHWKVSGELHNPEYITQGLNRPLFVKKATFHSYLSLIHTLLYSQIKFNLLKYHTSFSLLIISLIKNSGVLSFIVTWFSFL